MAIRDIFRRAVRKSGSSAGNSDATSDNSAPLSPIRSAKSSFAWRTTSNKSTKKTEEPTSPYEPPLTEANLRHQELLNAFTMTFGRSRRGSQAGRTSFGGVSPGASRNNSVDAGAAAGPRRSLAFEAPKFDTVREEGQRS